jgi:hypothetical protein
MDVKINKYLLILLFCFMLSLIFYFYMPVAPDATYQWTMLVLSLIGTFTYFLNRKVEFGSIYWLSLVPFFILGYLIVFYQMIVLDLAGFTVPTMFYEYIWANETVLNRSIGLATLGLLAFYLGEVYSRDKSPYKRAWNKNSKIETKSIAFLIILAYIFYILFLIASGSYIYGVYSSEDGLSSANYFYKAFEIALSAAIIVKLSFITSCEKQKLSFRKYLSFFGVPLLALVVWNILFSLFVGDRAPVMFFSVLTFGLYFIRWKRLNFILLCMSIFLASILFSFVGELRQVGERSNVDFSERITNITNYSEGKTSKKFDELVPGDATIEMALSVNTLNHALLNVPDKYDYRYGLFQLQYIYASIPGLSGVISEILYGSDTKFYSSSKFITYFIQGDQPTFGNGTSILADFYLDFGVIGIVIGLYLFGYFVGKNEYKLFSSYQQVTFSWVVILIFFSKALYLSRSSILFELSLIVFIYLLIKINKFIVSSLKKT